VIGLPDDYRGETVEAFVSLRAGHEVDEGELVSFCGERMAAYKRPRKVTVLGDLPKTASGKILRRELRQPGVAES
jgi:long-chain acyl-CoA synthetase